MKTELLSQQEIDGFTIKVFAEKEFHPVNAYLTWMTIEDKDRLIDQINSSGVTGWFCAVIKVYKIGCFLSYATINCCSYESREAFLNDPSFKNILSETLNDARNQLPLLIEKLRA